MSSPDNLLAAAKKAAVSGQRDQARQLLEILLRDEPENEEALILFASLAPDLGSMKRVLEQALLINPTNTRALAGMDWVRKQELLMLRQRMITPSSGGTAAPQTSPLREIIEREMAAQQAAQQAAQAPPAPPKKKEGKPLPPTPAPKTTAAPTTPPPAASSDPQISRARDRSRQSRLTNAGTTPPPGPQPVNPPMLVPEPIQPAASAPPITEPIIVPPAPATPPWDLGFNAPAAPEPRVAPLPPAPTPAAFVPLPFELPPLPTPPGMEDFDAGLGLPPENEPNPLLAGWPSNTTNPFSTGSLLDRLSRPDIDRTPTGPFTRTPTGPLTRTPTGPLTRTPTGPLANTPTGSLTRTPTGPLTRTPTGPLTKTPTGPLIRTATGPLTSPLTRHQTGPLDSPAAHLHQLEHSPSHAAAITEVPLYPNGAFRGLLLAMERMQGVNEVAKILRLADLNKYVGNYPADNLVPGVPYTEYSAFGQAMEQYYGEGARDILLRLGERIVTGGKTAPAPRGFAATAMRLLPSNIVMRRTLEGLVHDARDLGVLTDLDEREGSYHYIVAVCPYCYGRSTEVGCNALAGVLSASLRAATGRGYRVEEESCRGRGDETCTYRIAKTPSD